MQEGRIILPLELDGARDVLAITLVDTFGGFTMSEGKGAWKSPTGELFMEPVAIYDVAMAEHRSGDLLSIARRVLKLTSEQAIYVRLPDGRVEFVS